MNKFNKLENSICELQYEYIKTVITDVWKKDFSEYGLEVDTNIINLSDLYICFDDFITIAKREIPESICYEFFDSCSLNFDSNRILQFKKESEVFNLFLFHRYCLRNNTEFINKEKKELKKSDKAVKLALNELEKSIKQKKL